MSEVTVSIGVDLYNRSTHRLRTIAAETSSHQLVYAGQVNGNYVAWGRVTSHGQDVFLYDIHTKTSSRVPRPDAAFDYNPAVAADGTVYFVRSGNGCGKNVRILQQAPDGTLTKVVGLPDFVDAGFLHASLNDDGSTTLFVNRAKCKTRRALVSHPWDLYKVEIPAPASGSTPRAARVGRSHLGPARPGGAITPVAGRAKRASAASAPRFKGSASVPSARGG